MFRIEHNILNFRKNKKEAKETIRLATHKNLLSYLVLLMSTGTTTDFLHERKSFKRIVFFLSAVIRISYSKNNFVFPMVRSSFIYEPIDTKFNLQL